MCQQIEEWGCVQRQGGGLVREVEHLQARIMEQEPVITDGGPWEPQIDGNKVYQMMQERLDVWDKVVKAVFAQVKQGLREGVDTTKKQTGSGGREK